METFLRGLARHREAPSAKVGPTFLSSILGMATRHDAIKGNRLREAAPISVPRKEARALTAAGVRVLRRRLAEWKGELPTNGRRRRPDELLDIADVMLATGCRIPEALAVASAYRGYSSEAITGKHYRAKAPEAADMTAALAGFWGTSEEE